MSNLRLKPLNKRLTRSQRRRRTVRILARALAAPMKALEALPHLSQKE